MAAEIRVFPCLSDNFGYLIHDPQSRMTAAIDAPEAARVKFKPETLRAFSARSIPTNTVSK